MMTAYIIVGEDTRSHREPGGKPDKYKMTKGDIVIIDKRTFIEEATWLHSQLFGWMKAEDLKPITALRPGDAQRAGLVKHLLAVRENAKKVDENAVQALKMLGYEEIKKDG